MFVYKSRGFKRAWLGIVQSQHDHQPPFQTTNPEAGEIRMGKSRERIMIAEKWFI